MHSVLNHGYLHENFVRIKNLKNCENKTIKEHYIRFQNILVWKENISRQREREECDGLNFSAPRRDTRIELNYAHDACENHLQNCIFPTI